MPTKREDTPVRVLKRNYEEAHKEERNSRRGQFNTTISKKKLSEINEFLKANGFSKTELLQEGYCALQEVVKGERKLHDYDGGYDDQE